MRLRLYSYSPNADAMEVSPVSDKQVIENLVQVDPWIQRRSRSSAGGAHFCHTSNGLDTVPDETSIVRSRLLLLEAFVRLSIDYSCLPVLKLKRFLWRPRTGASDRQIDRKKGEEPASRSRRFTRSADLLSFARNSV